MVLELKILIQSKQKLSQLVQLLPKRFYANRKPVHLICFNNWTKDIVTTVINSAINLKCICDDTHGKILSILPHIKVLTFEDRIEPVLTTAVSKATTFLGATDVNIKDVIDWDRDYNGRIYSQMADIIFISTQKYECVRRFAQRCEVPVVSIRCRKHSTLQSLATFMSLIEDYRSLDNFNLAYIGAPHQVLNDYLILSAMFKMNFKFKCCCKECGISPLLLGDCKNMCESVSNVSIDQVNERTDALKNANAIIAGPTANKNKIPEFQLTSDLISKHTKANWTFYHTFPRGEEVNDELFWHCRSKTFNAFKNMQYIAAASMAFAIRDIKF